MHHSQSSTSVSSSQPLLSSSTFAAESRGGSASPARTTNDTASPVSWGNGGGDDEDNGMSMGGSVGLQKQTTRVLSSPTMTGVSSSQAQLGAAGGSSKTTGSPRMVGVARGDRKAVKKGTLEEASAILQVSDEEAQGVVGFDPRMWIIAAGVLEKRRDGTFRDGWAKRWFVLNGDALYYFLLPKQDLRGMCPLVGDERGQIHMADVESVQNGESFGEDPCIVHMVVEQVRKVGALPLATPITEIRLRAASPESGKMWTQALQKASTAARKRGGKSASPNKNLMNMRSPSPGLFLYPPSEHNQEGERNRRTSEPSVTYGDGHYTTTVIQKRPSKEFFNPFLSTSSATIMDSFEETPRLEETSRLEEALPTNLKISDADLEKLVPKFTPSSHLTLQQTIAIIVAVNSICYSDLSLFNFFGWFLANLVTVAILILFERQAVLYDATISSAKRAISDFQSEIRLTGISPAGRLARQTGPVTRQVTIRSTSIASESNFSTSSLEWQSAPLDTSSPSREGNFTEISTRAAQIPLNENLSPTPVLLPQADEEPSASSAKKFSWSAGTNMTKIESDIDNTNTSPYRMTASMSWFNPRGERFRLRIGPNYKVNAKKGPSADPLYELVGMDMLKSTEPIFHLASFINLPSPREGVDNLEAIKRSGLPRLIVINAQIPEKAPSMWGANSEDVGVSVVFYYTVKPETVNAVLDPPQRTPAIKLLHRFVTEWRENDDIRRRFKGIGFADNITELGIPGAGMVEKFNGKPVIIFKCAKFYQAEDYLEIDISIHNFPYVAKSGLHLLRDRVPDVKLLVGYVIQGETDDELPETLLGGAEIRGMDFNKAEFIPLP